MIENKRAGIKFNIKYEWPLLLLMLGALAYGAYIYPSLPEKVPSHWNIHGEVDGYSSAFWGAFGIPLLNLGLYVLFFVMPKIDPQKYKYVKFKGAYNVFRYVFHLFMTGLFITIVLAAQGLEVNISRWVPMGVGMLFIVIGNYMGKIRHNYFFGIKNPWTLANEEVWQRTHRFAGPIWMLAGVLGIVTGIIGGGYVSYLFFGILLFAAVIPMVYSYVIFRKIAN